MNERNKLNYGGKAIDISKWWQRWQKQQWRKTVEKQTLNKVILKVRYEMIMVMVMVIVIVIVMAMDDDTPTRRIPGESPLFQIE